MDQIVSLFMFALGMRNPAEYQGMVKGTETVAEQEVTPTPAVTDDEATESSSDATETKAEKLKAAEEARTARLQKLQEAKKEKYQKMLELQKAKAKKFQETLEKKREAAKEKYAAKREAFEAKLKSIRDEKKKQIVEHIDEKMAEINKRRTDAMMEHLNKMSEILVKVEERANSSGKDVTKVTAAISEAQGAISAAKAKVTEQAGKEYVITVGSDETLKTDVGQVMNTLTTDLKSVHALVVEARQKVSAAIKALGMLLGSEKVASPSGTL